MFDSDIPCRLLSRIVLRQRVGHAASAIDDDAIGLRTADELVEVTGVEKDQPRRRALGDAAERFNADHARGGGADERGSDVGRVIEMEYAHGLPKGLYRVV